jgi:uncharacterized protein YbjT (DUF2867 family)
VLIWLRLFIRAQQINGSLREISLYKLIIVKVWPGIWAGQPIEELLMIAVICGATGLVGSRLLQKLLSDAEFRQVVSVSRRKTGEKSPKLKEVIISDLGRVHEHERELSGDVFFCCLGTTIKKAQSRKAFRKVDFDSIVEFGKIAKKHSARSFVVISASGADSNSRIFYNRVKGETESALRGLQLNRLVILRPALLIGHRQESRPAEAVSIAIAQTLAPFFPKSVKSRIMTEIEVLAERMLSEGKSAQPGVFVLGAHEI